MNIIILNKSDMPIYEQIKEQIKNSIISGELEENEMLPSIRQLAKDLKISVITTTRAYSDLEKEGYIANVQGKGCFVEAQNKELIREKFISDIEKNFYAAVNSAKIINMPKEELLSVFEFITKEENYV